jgi:hypothetical protein
VADDGSGNGAEPHGRSERDRFEALLKKLLEVPKAELDKQRAKAKKRAAI